MNRFAKIYDLTEGGVWRTMLFYAAPIFFGTLFQSFYTTADAVIVGRFGGKEALAAIESVFTLTRLPVNFFMGIAAGATVLLSRYYGAKKFRDVSDASHAAIWFALVGGTALEILGCAVSPYAIRAVRVPVEISGEAQRYLLIYYAGMAATLVFNVGAGILRSLGNSRQPFVYLAAANFLNVGLDLVFVAGLRLGVVGAALATAISQVFCSCAVMRALMRSDLPCRIALNRLRFDRARLAEIFRLGLPIGVQSALNPISNTVIQTGINAFGVNSIAAWAVCGKLDFLVWSISDAFATAVSTFVAQNIGAKKFGRVKSSIAAGLSMSVIPVAAIGAILYRWGAPLASALVRDQDVIELTALILRFIAPFYAVFVFCDVLPGAIRGMGDTLRPMFVSLFGICLFRVLWILAALPLRPTLLTALACYPLSWALTAVVYAGLLGFGIRMKKPGWESDSARF